MRLRVIHQTDKETLRRHVHQFTEVSAKDYTDEEQGYLDCSGSHATVCHSFGDLVFFKQAR